MVGRWISESGQLQRHRAGCGLRSGVESRRAGCGRSIGPERPECSRVPSLLGPLQTLETIQMSSGR